MTATAYQPHDDLINVTAKLILNGRMSTRKAMDSVFGPLRRTEREAIEVRVLAAVRAAA